MSRVIAIVSRVGASARARGAAVAVLVVCLGLLPLGCGGGAEGEDGGSGSADASATDGGRSDGGATVDAGAIGADAGTTDSGVGDDSGVGEDGGVSDAGTTPGDAGAGDAGVVGSDAGSDGGTTMDAGVDAGTAAMDAGVDGGTAATDAGVDGGTAATDAGAPASLPLSIGYYVEDPVDNPEDPTVGTLLISIPTTDGAFTGQIPFGYVGCDAGADVASLSGTRTGSTLSGTWSGAVDGTSVSGTFGVMHSAALGRWDGTFTTTGGKVMVSFPPCEYYVAGHGTVRIFDSPTNEPASFVATSTGGTSPTFSWPSLGGSVGYVVRVFDADCVVATPGSPTCFMGEALMLGTTVSYPGGFSGSRGALTVGRTYVATITAQRLSGGFEGFSPIVLRP